MSVFAGCGTVVLRTQVGDMVLAQISHAEQIYDKIQLMVNKMKKPIVMKGENEQD